MSGLTRALVPPGCRHLRRPRRHERGSVTLQVVILLPLLFLVMFLGLQAALWYQARTACLSAAQEGARAAAAERGSAGAGSAAAEDFLAAGTTGVSSVSVSSTRSATDASVTVRAVGLSVLPGWNPQIEQTASMPVERLTQ